MKDDSAWVSLSRQSNPTPLEILLISSSCIKRTSKPRGQFFLVADPFTCSVSHTGDPEQRFRYARDDHGDGCSAAVEAAAEAVGVMAVKRKPVEEVADPRARQHCRMPEW